MFKNYFFISLLVANTLVFNMFAADVQKYRQNNPFFYAVLANASYENRKNDVQKSIDKMLGYGKATVKKKKKFSRVGNTRLILVDDKKGGLHVAIEGSSDVGNWIGNLLVYPVNGFFQKHDAPKNIICSMHKIIKKWRKDYGDITTISGHSQGGMFASQIAHYKKDKYKNIQIITFNAFKPKKDKNQMHFAIATENAVTLCSPSGRYIPVNVGQGSGHIIANHQMKFFLSGLKNKNWNQVL